MRKLLLLSDREEISRGLAEGVELKEIAQRVGRDPSVVSRDVARHGGRVGYRAAAQEAAEAARARPKLLAVERSPRLRAVVTALLRGGWSPGSTAGRLPADYPQDESCRVSHEAIYTWVYAQPVSTLARELLALRSGRTARRGGARPAPAPRIRGSTDPRAPVPRRTPGRGRRPPRPRALGRRPGDRQGRQDRRRHTRRAHHPVPGAGSADRPGLPHRHLRGHRRRRRAPRPAAAVADLGLRHGDGPARRRLRHRPPGLLRPPALTWERGSNENLNRIVREFFPKGVEITADPNYLAAVAAEINDRPRKIHAWKKPSELFTELLDSHAFTDPACHSLGRRRRSCLVRREGDDVEPESLERRLLAVHAHPDDESITTGGLLARCSDRGIRASLVTCTDGRHGPVNPELGLSLTPDQLAKTRAEELRAAAKTLRVDEVYRLGFHDSGMTGSPHNAAPLAMWAQPIDSLLQVLVSIVRHVRPHVVVTYDPFGNTGHPDHVQTHRLTLLAIEAASESRTFPSRQEPWHVQQVFYPVFPVSALEQFIADELGAGRPHPFDGRAAAEVNYTRPDQAVTHRVNIAPVYELKRDALHCHRTQVGPHYPKLYRAALARRQHEHFRLAASALNRRVVDFSDIFEPAGA